MPLRCGVFYYNQVVKVKKIYTTMIIKFPRKFQAGGNLSAKTEYVPIDLKWEDTGKDIKPEEQFKVATENLSADDKYENYKLGGLSSDKQSLYTEIESVKERMKGGTNDSYTKEAYENDAKILHRLLTVEVPDATQQESRFKEIQTAVTPAKSDLAINNGKAFVLDLVTGKYDIVGVDKMLTQRASGKDGKKTHRYIPQTVGMALEAREGDTSFTGRRGGKGQELEEILHSIQSTKDLQTQLKAAFSGVGSSGDKETNLQSIGGAPANELYNMVLQATGAPTTGPGKTTMAITSDSVKTNKSQLMNAYNLLTASVQASGLGETLKRNAYIAYMNEFRDKDEAPNYHEYVNEKVNEQLNNAMLSYLRENYSDSLGLKTVGGGSGSSGESKDKYELNHVNEALDMSGVPIEIFPSNDEAKKELKGRTIFNSTVFPDVTLFTRKGYEQANEDNLPRTVATNTVMANWAANGSLQGNLFLANQTSTQLSELANGQGLSQAVLYPGRAPMIIHDMPVVFNARDNTWSIAWSLLLDGKGKDDSTHVKALKLAEEMVGGPMAERAVFDKALEVVYNRLKLDPKVGNLGDIQIRKVIKYDLIVPANPKSFWGTYKSETDKYKSMITEPNIIKDKSMEQMYNALITPAKEGGVELNIKGDLYEIPAFSVMAANTTLRNFSGMWYPSNKIETEKARQYSGEKQHQQTNLIGD